MTPVQSNRHWLFRSLGGKYGYLLTALILLVVSSPAITINRACSVAIATLTSGVLVACIYAARPRRRSLALGLCLAVTDLAIGQIAASEGIRFLHGVQFVLGAIIMIYALGSLLEFVLGGGKVTVDTLQAALCAYLLLGMIWTEFYSLSELIWPNSISVALEPDMTATGYKLLKSRFLHLLYFSYATLTTVGMEGVVPASNTVRMLVCAEAITGQIYLTMLIARLVGMHVAQWPAARTPIDSNE
jgi:hypothetical protein